MNKGTLLVDTLKYFKTKDIVCRVQGSEQQALDCISINNKVFKNLHIHVDSY